MYLPSPACSCREGQLLSRELRDLPPKQAFCLAALPALHQAHVLSLVPTSLPVTQALEKLGAGAPRAVAWHTVCMRTERRRLHVECWPRRSSRRPPVSAASCPWCLPSPCFAPAPPPTCPALARVEDFYDSIGGLAGYQAQCLALISQQREQGLARPPHGAATGSSSSSTSSMESLASTDPAWPEGFSPAAPGSSAAADTEYLIPVGLDLDSPCQAGAAAAAVAAGIDALPHMAEIYPLGGAGDRLGLRCERTGESLPTAVLQYCGRSLLENLLRDLQVRGGGEGAPRERPLAGGEDEAGGAGIPNLAAALPHRVTFTLSSPTHLIAPAALQAREYLHWQLRGVQHTTPIAIMTSAAKGNHWRVAQLFDEASWGNWPVGMPPCCSCSAAAFCNSLA